MDNINSELASQPIKLIIRHIMNQRDRIFRGDYAAQYPHLVEAFHRLTRDVDQLDKNLSEDLASIINDGICEMARNFGDGLPVLPSTMNLIILAIRTYNATPYAPFKIYDKVPCQNVTTDGLLFLSNVIIRVINSFPADPQQALFPLDHPPWQLAVRRVLPKPTASEHEHAVHMSRAPCIFIIHAHGMLPVVQGEVDDPTLPVFDNPVMGYPLGPHGNAISSSSYRSSQVVKLKSRVDTFTSAKFGKPIWLRVAEDPPQVPLVDKLTSLLGLHSPRSSSSPKPKTKDYFRKIIKKALCDTRDLVVPGNEHDTCRFRCHRVGRKIADVTLFCDGAAFVEGIVKFDAQTGEVDYVTEQFGLVDKRSLRRPVKEYEKSPKFNKRKIELLIEAKTEAEQKLAAMKANPVDFKGKRFRMHSLAEAIENYETTIRNMDRYSNYEFSDDVKERGGDKIRLSRLIDIGILGGLINPDDFVVVLSCRVPDGTLPLGAVSPRSSSDSSLSEGGSKRRPPPKTKTKTKTKTNHNASKKLKPVKPRTRRNKRRN
jgi:hypothetical protein